MLKWQKPKRSGPLSPIVEEYIVVITRKCSQSNEKCPCQKKTFTETATKSELELKYLIFGASYSIKIAGRGTNSLKYGNYSETFQFRHLILEKPKILNVIQQKNDSLFIEFYYPDCQKTSTNFEVQAIPKISVSHNALKRSNSSILILDEPLTVELVGLDIGYTYTVGIKACDGTECSQNATHDVLISCKNQDPSLDLVENKADELLEWSIDRFYGKSINVNKK